MTADHFTESIRQALAGDQHEEPGRAARIAWWSGCATLAAGLLLSLGIAIWG